MKLMSNKINDLTLDRFADKNVPNCIFICNN